MRLLPSFSAPSSSSIKCMNSYDLLIKLGSNSNSSNRLCLTSRESSSSSSLSLAISMSIKDSNTINSSSISNTSNSSSISGIDLFGGQIMYGQQQSQERLYGQQQSRADTNTNPNRMYEQQQSHARADTNTNTNRMYEQQQAHAHTYNDTTRMYGQQQSHHNTNTNTGTSTANTVTNEKRKYSQHVDKPSLPPPSSSLSKLLAPPTEKEQKEHEKMIKKIKTNNQNESSKTSSSSSSLLLQSNKHNTNDINTTIKTTKSNTKSKTNNNTSSSNSTNNNTSSGSISSNDFDGIGNFCRNAGKSSSTLDYILSKLNDSRKKVSLALLWKGLSSSHATSTVSYCTPKSACHVWHCKCDKHIRADIAYQPLIGVIFLFSDDRKYCYFIPLSHANNEPHADSDFCIPFHCDTTITQRWDTFINIMNSSNIDKIVYNAQLLQFPLLLKDIQVTMTTVFDIKIACHLLEPDISDDNLELDKLLKQYNITTTAPSNTNDLGIISNAISNLHGELGALLDMEIILHKKLMDLQLLKCFKAIEMPLTTLLTMMELKGITISIKNFDSISIKVDKLIKSIVNDAKLLLEQRNSNINTNTINFASPEQVATLLYDNLGLPKPVAKHKQRHYSTGEEELTAIKHLHPIVGMILNHRTIAKIKSTYIDSYRNYIRSNTNTIHSTFNQTSTRTGRLSSSKPNVQQIPNVQTITIDNSSLVSSSSSSSSSSKQNSNQLRELQLELGLPVDDVNTTTTTTDTTTTDTTNATTITKVDFVLRSMFVARKGTVLVSADYSQIEMRVFAHLCNDQKLKEIFINKGDIYTNLACLIFRKNVELVTDVERQKAKVICLGQVYGMSPDMAAQKLNISINEAQKVFEAFFSTFRTVKEWSDKQVVKATSEGFVRTICGRRRYLPDLRCSDFTRKSTAGRQAINTIVQGSAADILKFAMIMINDNCKALVQSGYSKESIPSLLLQVHDEVIYEVPISNLQNLSMPEIMSQCQPFVNIIKSSMEDKVKQALGISVPLIANVTIGEDWGDMKDYK